MKYLVTGVTGSGKSSVAKELRKLGLTAYDGDKVSKLGQWQDADGAPAKVPPRLTKDWISKHVWNWNKEYLDLLLTRHPEVFICGASSNQHNFYNLFDKVFLLSVSQQTLLKRLRARNGGFGKFRQEMIIAKQWHSGFDSFQQQFGVIKIDANQPLAVVIQEILSHTNLNAKAQGSAASEYAKA